MTDDDFRDVEIATAPCIRQLGDGPDLLCVPQTHDNLEERAAS